MKDFGARFISVEGLDQAADVLGVPNRYYDDRIAREDRFRRDDVESVRRNERRSRISDYDFYAKEGTITPIMQNIRMQLAGNRDDINDHVCDADREAAVAIQLLAVPIITRMYSDDIYIPSSGDSMNQSDESENDEFVTGESDNELDESNPQIVDYRRITVPIHRELVRKSTESS